MLYVEGNLETAFTIIKNRADAFLNAQKYNLAKKEYEKALRIKPQDPEIYEQIEKCHKK